MINMFYLCRKKISAIRHFYTLQSRTESVSDVKNDE